MQAASVGRGPRRECGVIQAQLAKCGSRLELLALGCNITDLCELSRSVLSFTVHTAGSLEGLSFLLCLFSDKRPAVIVFRGASQ